MLTHPSTMMMTEIPDTMDWTWGYRAERSQRRLQGFWFVQLLHGRLFTGVWNRRMSSRLGQEQNDFSFGYTQFEELRHGKTSM